MKAWASVFGALLVLALGAGSATAQEPVDDDAPAVDEAPGSDAAPTEADAPVVGEGADGEGATEEAPGAAAAEVAEDEAAAPPPPGLAEASDRMARGIGLYDDGNYEGALSEFERAYELAADHPARFQVLFNMARAQERLFRYDDAIEVYRRFLDEGGPELENYAMVQAKIETLEGLLGTLVIAVNVATAEVWVDDHLVGTAPGSIRVTGGRHSVELRAPNYVAEQQDVQVTARAEAELTFELEALADEYNGLAPGFFYGAVGATVAALGVGIGFGVAALGARNTIDARDPPLATPDEVSHIDSLALTADIFYVTAGVFAAAAVVLGIFTDWGGEEAAPQEDGVAGLELRVQPLIGPDGAGLLVGGSL